MITHFVTLSSKGQITIPVAMQKKLNLVKGKQLQLKLTKNNSLELKSGNPNEQLLKLKGILRQYKPVNTLTNAEAMALGIIEKL
jgi:bifunctional DNA-binding transcriptional regulator/antitoxin component of YhaV-PrlF toxin-antitoxin module